MDAASTVLSALHVDTGRYGLDLIRDTGLSSGRLYPTLVRLRRAGRIRESWTADGRRRYLLTADGVTRVEPRSEPALWRWLPALAVALVLAAAAFARPAGDRLADLDVYVGATAGLRHGASLYDFVGVGGAPFTYPPFAGLVLLPLAFGATVPVQVLWTAATVAAVLALATVAAGRTAAPPLALALAASAPVSSNLRFGQVSVGLAALVAVDVLALHRWRYHGVLVGLAAAVKLTPLVFVPMLWFGGRRRAAVVAASTCAACGALAWHVLPADSWRYWGTEIWRLERIGDLASTGNQSLHGALLRVGCPGLLVPIAGTVAVLALRRAARAARAGDWLAATIVTGAAGIALSPVSWTHHQVWLVLAVLLPVRGAVPVRWLWRVTVLAVMVLPVTALGAPVWDNARALLAVAVAALVPLRVRAG